MSKKKDMSALTDAFKNVQSTSTEIQNDNIDSQMNENKKIEQRKRRLTVDIDKLIPNELNMYSMNDDDEFAELLAGLEKDGQLEEIIVKDEDENGKYKILSGHRRYVGMLKKGIKKARIQIEDEFTAESSEIAFIARGNTGARQKYPYDIASQLKLYYSALDKEGNPGNKKQMAREGFNLTEKTLYNYEQLASLPDIIIQWGREGWLTRDDGIVLSKIQSEDNGEKSIKDFISRVKSAMKDNMSNKDKSMLLKRMTANMKKANKKNQANIKSLPNVSSAIKRIDKIVNTSLIDPSAYSIPKQQAKKDEAKRMIDDTIKKLERIKITLD